MFRDGYVYEVCIVEESERDIPSTVCSGVAVYPVVLSSLNFNPCSCVRHVLHPSFLLSFSGGHPWQYRLGRLTAVRAAREATGATALPCILPTNAPMTDRCSPFFSSFLRFREALFSRTCASTSIIQRMLVIFDYGHCLVLSVHADCDWQAPLLERNIPRRETGQ